MLAYNNRHNAYVWSINANKTSPSLYITRFVHKLTGKRTRTMVWINMQASNQDIIEQNTTGITDVDVDEYHCAGELELQHFRNNELFHACWVMVSKVAQVPNDHYNNGSAANEKEPVPHINISLSDDKITVEINDSNPELHKAFVNTQLARQRTTDMKHLPILDALVAVVKMTDSQATISGMAYTKEQIRCAALEEIHLLSWRLETRKASIRQKIELCGLMLGMLVGQPCTYRSGSGIFTDITSSESTINVKIIKSSSTTTVETTFFDGTKQKVNECDLFFLATDIRRCLAGPFAKGIHFSYYAMNLSENPWETHFIELNSDVSPNHNVQTIGSNTPRDPDGANGRE